MNTRRKALVLLMAASFGAGAQEVDTSGWDCEFCPFADGFLGSSWVGAGNVSDDAFRFENYSGLEDGPYGIIGIDALLVDPDSYWTFQTSDLFLDSRRAEVDGGKPGSWRLNVSWSEVPFRFNDTGASPYSGVGGDTLSLPADWVYAPNTGGMELLQQSLRPVELASDRDTFELGIEVTPAGNFEYALKYERQMKEGIQTLGGGFMFTSSILPAPIDYVTDQLDASVTYAADGWSAQLSYYGSFFENDNLGLLFDNPFNPVSMGADQGRFALAPDNEFHRVGVSGFYRASDRIRLSGSLGFGRMSQDDSFLPYTVNTTNPNINPGPLPRNTFDGEVEILDFKAGMVMNWSSRLRLDLDYRFYDRDNSSPIDEYRFVTQELYVNPARRNTPFSYQRQQITAEGSYRFDGARLSAGVGYEEYDREQLERPSDTDETELWARLNLPFGAAFDARFAVSYSERDGDRIDPQSFLSASENPLLQKFNFADRDRSQLEGSAIFSPTDTLQFGLHVSIASDDYTESLVGLTESESVDSTLDITLTPSANLATHLFVSWEDIEAAMVGSNTASTADWFADTRDRVNTGGVGVTWSNLGERGAQIGFDYVYSRSASQYDVQDGTNPAAFPDLDTKLKGTRLRVTWPLKTGAELVFDAYHETWDSEDWAIEGLQQDSLFNLLAFGEQALNHSVSTFGVWYRSDF